jgi:hypothetical protein
MWLLLRNSCVTDLRPDGISSVNGELNPPNTRFAVQNLKNPATVALGRLGALRTTKLQSGGKLPMRGTLKNMDFLKYGLHLFRRDQRAFLLPHHRLPVGPVPLTTAPVPSAHHRLPVGPVPLTTAPVPSATKRARHERHS